MLPSKIFFDNFFDDFEPVMKYPDKMMKCDIYLENGNYILEMDAPGFSKEDISMELEDGYLKIVAEKKMDSEKSNKKYVRRERHFHSKYERQFYVGDVSDSDIKAEFKNGILKVTFPKVTDKKEQKKLINID